MPLPDKNIPTRLSLLDTFKISDRRYVAIDALLSDEAAEAAARMMPVLDDFGPIRLTYVKNAIHAAVDALTGEEL